MPSLKRHRRDWEDLARFDSLSAVLRRPERHVRPWTQEEFFTTGEWELTLLLGRAGELGRPHTFGSALDFGCGVGRVTRALAARFEAVQGVDISESMIREARELNADLANCSFTLSSDPDLRRFPSHSFDLVFSVLVLQHLPHRRIALRYVEEFVRLLTPGGVAIFQVPSHVPPRRRLQLRRRLYRLLRALGVRPTWLNARAGLDPIRTMALAEAEVVRTVQSAGGVVLLTEPNDAAGPLIDSLHYYVALADGEHSGE